MTRARPARRVTIVDVAAHAGVSTAAVSKVLRNAYGTSPAMIERVRASMAELGYRPHAAARGMRGRTFTVGVLLDSIRNPFFAEVLDGVRDGFDGTDYHVFVGAAGFSPQDQRAMADAMVDRQMDGIVVVGPSIHPEDVADIARGTPTVVIGPHDPVDGYDAVVHDEFAGARAAVQHLHALGHRRIALAGTLGTPGNRWARRPEVLLEEGYRAAMAAAGLGEHVRVVHGRQYEEGGRESGTVLLTGSPRPTAILAWTDAAALGVFQAASELGIGVPADLSLVGYNNTSLATLTGVALTSVDQAGAQMGTAAATLLLERLEGRTRDTVVTTTPQVVVRRSTAATGTTGTTDGTDRAAAS
ncbi:LacI family DNA-binding transcriptional regulator [Kineosporia sp. R_H_3]|uniref:LacI family DNA-binding transcriptional regulator n=1 Tax=Kineosporia sp. R_H_3 TaxID=1961848 RepID=UPI000B4AFA89|nr:LacI family DNA-binding transcriptional regulator [Kineosporia sp. R_H_3]